ncbi:hypothetical protein BZK31_21615 [Pseudomonas floridensis]|uniref:Uncharacterized protein n=1 Tax=Pseudomonas floridensis TaxID=1958950 RepID=A0A1X0N1D8_9PSED|nr:hypothetical protein BZK31_21615 [Pseudomonas floridensis]
MLRSGACFLPDRIDRLHKMTSFQPRHWLYSHATHKVLNKGVTGFSADLSCFSGLRQHYAQRITICLMSI